MEVDSGVTVDLSGVTITGGNSGSGHGGGILNEGSLRITDSAISQNIAPGSNFLGDGGGIYNSGSLVVTNSTVTANQSFGGTQGHGGAGIFNAGNAQLIGCAFSHNNSTNGDGGAVLNGGSGTLTFTRCSSSNDEASFAGGGIGNFTGTVTVTDSNFTSDFGGFGAAIGGESDVPGTITVSNTTFSKNMAQNAGAISNPSGTLVVSDSSFNANIADGGAGGAIYTGHDVNGGPETAGCTVTGSTFYANSGGVFGGALANLSIASVTNSTFDGNGATDGGAIETVGTLTLTHCTITRNVGGSANGMGLNVVLGTAVVNNTIIAGNLKSTFPNAPSDISGKVTGSYNLIGIGGSGGLTNGVNGNLVGVADPKLAPLADHGGPTMTIAPLPGSPAIDAGSNAIALAAGVSTDQRGYFRFYDGDGDGVSSADVGAFELHGNIVVGTTSDQPSGPQIPLRMAVAGAAASPGDDTVAFHIPLNDPGFDPSTRRYTLKLALGQLEVSDTSGRVIVRGPGADALYISGNQLGRIFQIDSGVNAEFDNFTIIGGKVADRGGGVLNDGTLAMSGCGISGNVAGDAAAGSSGAGGGIENGATLTLTGCIISGNSAGTGGGIDNESTGTLGLAGTSVAANVANIGGGLHNGGIVTIGTSTIDGNTATGSGAGLSNDAMAVISGTTFASNSASDSGGGIENPAAATLILTDSTLSGNAASTGAGIENSGRATLTNCTVSGNTAATAGGGINSSAGNATAYNTIVALNHNRTGGADDIHGVLDLNLVPGQSGSSFNLIGTGGSGGLVNGADGNIVGLADPKLGPLSDNGGPTLTIPLLSGSPAIDAGSNSLALAAGLTIDQRGYFRFYDGAGNGASVTDIGAYEARGTIVVTTTVDQRLGPQVPLRMALAGAAASPGDDTVTFKIPSGDPGFDPATGRSTIQLSLGQLVISDTSGRVTLRGPGADALTISGSDLSRVFFIANRVTAEIDGMTISHGHAADGMTGADATDPKGVGGIGGRGDDGGAIFIAGGTVSLAGVVIRDSTAGTGGGAGNAIGGDAGAGGAGGSGGGIYVSSGAVSLTDLTVSGNRAGNAGSGGNTIAGNGGAGGAGGSGGGIDIAGGSVTFTRDRIAGNGAGNGGAGGNTIHGVGRTSGAPGAGGGISLNAGSVFVLASTIDGNTGGNSGGGIDNAGILAITDSTISGNTSYYGGGLANRNTLTSTNNTIAFNSASYVGGGIAADSGSAFLSNTIVAGNVAGLARLPSDVVGFLGVGGTANLIGAGGSGGLADGVDGNIVGVADPKLGPLSQNGGPTPTIALLTGSPAIDHGSNALAVLPTGTPLITDQRGFARRVNGSDDIGSFEFGSAELRPGDANGDTKVNFADLLILAQNYGKKTGATFWEGDFTSDGAVGFPDLLILAQNYGGSDMGSAASSSKRRLTPMHFTLG